MWGFDPLLTQTLMILAASGPPACTMPEPAKINVIPKTSEVKYDYSKPMAAMQGGQTGTINPYSFHTMSATQGLMQAELELRYQTDLDYSVDTKTGGVCIWYKQIDVSFTIAPTIQIAKEVYDSPCMRQAVTEHEMKHVMTDRKVVNKYAQVIGQNLYKELGARGWVAGPVPQANAQAVAERMQATVNQIIEHEYKKMGIERTEAQREIDSLEEYEAVGAKCPLFEMPDGVAGTSPY